MANVKIPGNNRRPGNSSQTRTESATILVDAWRDPERRFPLRKRPQHAETGARTVAAGARRGSRHRVDHARDWEVIEYLKTQGTRDVQVTEEVGARQGQRPP